MIDIEKNYQIAKTLVGDLYKDLVHHCYLKVYDKKLNHSNTYFYMVMISELNKNKAFKKQYQLRNSEINDSILFGINEPNNHNQIDQLESILNNLKSQGHTEEVEIVLLSETMPIKEITKKTNLNRKTITEIRNFVKQEIKKAWKY